jgi:O-antigen/teichoic acid export membrane protein
MSSTSSSHAVLSGLSWTYLSTIAVNGMQLFSLLIISRLLTPQEIGLFAMTTLLSTIVERVGHLGIAPALVQKKELSDGDQRIANTIAVLIGVGMACTLLLFRDGVAAFMGDPQLATFIPACAALILIDSLLSTSESLMQREMLFKKISQSEVLAYALGNIVVAASLALMGFGVWALMIGALCGRLVKCTVIWRVIPPRIGANLFSQQAFQLIRLGLGFSAGRLLTYVALQGDNLVVGKLLGPSALGAYSRAYQLISLPADFMGKAFEKVWFTVMARRQEDSNKLQSLYLASVEIVALVCIPCSVVMMLYSREIIALALGAQWTAAVPVLNVLAFGVFLRAAYKPSETLVRSLGAVFSLAGRQVVYATMVLCGATLGANAGNLYGVALGVVGALGLHFVLSSHLACHLLRLSVWSFLRSLSAGIWVGTVLFIVLLSVRWLVEFYTLRPIISCALVFAVSIPTVIGCLLFAPRICRLHYAIQLIAPHVSTLKLPSALKIVLQQYVERVSS